MSKRHTHIKNQFKRKEKEQKPGKQWKKISFGKNERITKVAGIALLGLSLFLILSFISYLLTWKADQSLVEELNWDIIKTAYPDIANNWMGLVGAYVSHLFIYRWFGISSFIFIFLIGSFGVSLLIQTTFLPLKRFTIYSLFLILWFSLFLGFTFNNTIDFLGGAFGYHAQIWFKGVIGSAGTAIFLFFTIASFLFYAFNISIEKIQLFLKSLVKKERQAIENHSEVIVDEDFNVTEHVGSEENNEFDLTHPVTSNSETGKNVNGDSALNIKLKGEEGDPELEIEDIKEDDEDDTSDIKHSDYDPTLELSNYEYPSIQLLNDYDETNRKIDEAELEERKDLIVNTLKNYNIDIDKIRATVGPTVTLYEIIPAAGIRISKIKNLEDDIALSLSALGIRIIAPIPGKGTIGIEVPNKHPEIVSIKSVLSSSVFKNSDYQLPIALGKTISNEIFISDLTKMPHLLMAGATGQGKSVGINTILSSLLYKLHPSQVKFVLVDPKKVELSLFNKIENHFLARLPDNEEAIITDTSQVVHTLSSLCVEMDERYDLLKEAHVRNIKEYNRKFINRRLNPEKGHRYLPYIVLVIDELADLMMTAGKEVETPIARLAQLARAIGIHLIVATQRPSVNIITGVIKANFPARVAFRVTSKVDSRTILDAGGAEQLIGRGDMLLSTGGEIIRLQCAFVDTDEIERITDFIGDQQAYPEPMELPESPLNDGKDKSTAEEVLEDLDEMFEEAARIIVQHQQGSTSLLQRRLKLGYNRAGRIVDQLEAVGIVGPNEGSKAREVLIGDEYALEQFLTNLRDKK